MTHGALRVSAIALGAAAFVSLSPLSAASARDVNGAREVGRRNPASSTPMRITMATTAIPTTTCGGTGADTSGMGIATSIANPGAAAAAGVIGGILGAGVAAGYPYGCDPYGYGYCPGYDWGDYYGPYYGGFGYGYGPGFGYG